MTCSPKIRPENSVRRFSKPAPLVLRLVEDALISPNCTALEVGAGSLRNALYLKEAGHRVSVVELPAVVKKFSDQYDSFVAAGGQVYTKGVPKRRFDLVLSTFAIETICPPALRKQVLKDMSMALKKKALLALALRGTPDVKTSAAKGQAYQDGYVTPNRTFIRPYTVPEIRKILAELGLESVQFFNRVERPQIINVTARKPDSAART